MREIFSKMLISKIRDFIGPNGFQTQRFLKALQVALRRQAEEQRRRQQAAREAAAGKDCPTRAGGAGWEEDAYLQQDQQETAGVQDAH